MRLTWQGLDAAVHYIAGQCQGLALSGVYGVPRGGLPLAVALSHRLGIPLAISPGAGVLVVDDIYDSGKTIRDLRERHPGAGPFWVWATREFESEGYYSVLNDIGPEWVLFPWEVYENADSDRLDYEGKRQ